MNNQIPRDHMNDLAGKIGEIIQEGVEEGIKNAGVTIKSSSLRIDCLETDQTDGEIMAEIGEILYSPDTEKFYRLVEVPESELGSMGL